MQMRILYVSQPPIAALNAMMTINPVLKHAMDFLIGLQGFATVILMVSIAK
jgi:hypothetical protein